MSLDRKDYKSAIPQLDARLSKVEDVGKKGLANFDILQDLIEKEIAERQRLYLKQDTSINTITVKMYYLMCASGVTPTPDTAGWSETMPKIDYSNDDQVLWYMSKTFRNGAVIETSTPQQVQLMDGVFAFINSVADEDNNWTTIDGGKISTGRIQDNINGDNYFDLDSGEFNFQDSNGNYVRQNGNGIQIQGTLSLSSEVGNSTLQGVLTDLQNQIDGNITTWFYAYVPTNANVPASDWITAGTENEHLGDLFYDTTTGYAYRWQSDGATPPNYSWLRITDSDVTKALADAAAAQDTADHKRRVFVTTPTPPYDIGDLWAEGSSGDIKKCKTAKADGQSYSASDWELASKYTDDTVANTKVKDSQRIYYRKSSSGAPSAPNTWVTTNTNVYGQWTTKVPPLAANTNEGTTKYPYLYSCIQTRTSSSATPTCSTVLLDENTTVIDGGQIITNSITANQIQTGTITVGSLSDGSSYYTSAQTDSAIGTATASLLTSVTTKDQYYLSTSSSSATGGSWQDTVPTWTSGKYIWTRVATTKTPSSGSATTSYSTAVYDSALTSALSTASSAQTSANSSASTVVTTKQYYLSTSSSSATGGSWGSSVPTWTSGKYIWTRYEIVTTTVGGASTTTYSPSSAGVYDATMTEQIQDALDSYMEVKTASGSIASFSDASEYPVLEVITDINAKQAGSGTPSPSNPRAISGYSTIGTYATGTNLLENNVTSQTATVTDTFTIVRNDDGSLTFNGTATGTRVLIGNLATNFVGTSAGQNDGKKHIPNGTWKMTTHCSNTGIRLQVVGTNNPTGTASVTSISTSADTNITIDDTYAYNWVRINITSGTYNNVTIYPTIAPTTDYVYTPFGNSYATPLPSTVYGGTLDVTKGLLTVTHGIVDLSTLSWTYSSNYSTTGRAVFYVQLADIKGKSSSQVADCTAEKYETASTSSVTTTAGGKIGVVSNVTPNRIWCSTLDQSDTPSGNLVYELTTSQTYNVSPQQIQLLQGTNNVWTDSGDVDVKYAIISAGAVEALREPIDNASKTATSYITQIDEGGIKVHDAGDQSNYAKIDANGFDVYKNGNSVAFYGDTARIGKSAGDRFQIDSSALNMYLANEALPIFSIKKVANISKLLLDTSYCDIDLGDENGWISTNGVGLSMDTEDYDVVSLYTHRASFSFADYDQDMHLRAGAYYRAKDYAHNDAQIHVVGNSKDVWIGVGAGGDNHGLYSEDESAWIAMSDGTYNYTDNSFGPYVTSSGSDGYYLGWSTKRWRGVYSYNAPNSVSDKKHKDIIGDIDFAKDLIMNLKPVEYQWKDSDHKRIHMGFIAQDSAEVAKELGKDLSFYEAHYQDGSDYHGEETDDANLNWGMMYTELIAPLVKVVQQQQKEIDELKSIVEELAKEKKC